MWFKKLADSVYHGLNPFDGGQGWTSRAPARRPQPTRRPTSFAEEYRQRNNTAFAGNRYAQQQQQQQQPQGPQYKAPESNERSFLEKIMDQANIFDNNRTYKQATPTQSKSSFQQLGQAGGQVSRNMFPATLQTINSTGEFLGDTVDLGRVGVARATGNKQAERAALNRGLASRYSAPGQGLFGVGGLITSEQAQKPIAPSDLTKKIVGKGIEAYTEGKGLKMGGFVGKELLDQGVKQGFKSQLPNIGKNYLLNTVQGGVSAYNAGGSKEDIMKNALLSGPIGTVADVGLGVGFAGIKSKIKPAAADGLGKSKVAFKGAAEASDEPAYLRNRPNTVEGKRLQQQKGVEIPMGKKKMSPAERAYRQAQPTNEQPAFMRGPEAESAQALVNQQRYNQALQAFDDSTLGVPQGAPNGRPRVQLQEMPTEAPRKQTPLEVADAQAGIRPLDPETVGAAKRIVDAPNTQKLQAEIDAIDARAVAERRPLTDTEKVRVALNLEKMGKAPKSTQPKGKKARVVEKPTVKMKEAPLVEAKPGRVPGLGERAALSANGIISRFGEPGKKLARAIEESLNQKERGIQDFLNRVPTVQKLKKEFPAFVDALDALSRGESPNMSPKVAQAVSEYSSHIQSIAERARAAGLDVGDLGPYYFPREYKNIHKGGRSQKKMVASIMKEKGVSELDAVKQLEFMRNEYSKPFGNLEKSRYGDVGGYEKSFGALGSYLDRAYKRITLAEQLEGPQLGLVNETKKNLIAQGYTEADLRMLDDKIKVAIGSKDYDPKHMKISSFLRKYNALTSLSTAGVLNMQQPINTLAIGGPVKWTKGLVKIALSPEARRNAYDAGVLQDHMLGELAGQATGTTGKIASNVAAPLFRTIEHFNRLHAAIVGDMLGDGLVKKAAKGDVTSLRMLEKLGIEGPYTGKITPEQQVQAARGLTKAAQFKIDPMFMPGWADSPAGKVAIQFKPFGYKQTSFMWNFVLKEAMKGNAKPLMTWLVAAPLAGAGGTATKDFLLQRDSSFKNEDGTDKSNVQKYAEGLLAAGTLGLGNDVLYIGQKVARGDDNISGAIVSSLGGPTVSKVSKAVDNTVKGITKGNWKPAVKQAVTEIPGGGKTLGNLLSKENMPLESDYKSPAKAPKEGEQASPAYLKEQAKKEREDLEKRKSLEGNTLQKLSDGSYAYTLEGEADVKSASSLKKAREAIAMHSFENSNDKSKVIGDRHYFINENGEAKSEYKFKYEFDKVDAYNKLEMDIARDAEDYGTWKAIATKQITSLEKLRDNYNKEGQEDEVDKTQLKIENLKQSMRKYASYGGAFTKGRSGYGSGGGGGRGAGETANIGKYSVDLNFGGRPSPVKVAAKTTSHKSGGGSGSGGGGKPKVSIKKSMV